MPKPFDATTPRGAPAHAPDATAAYEQPAIPPSRRRAGAPAGAAPPPPAFPPPPPPRKTPTRALPAALLVLIVAGAALAYLRPWQARAPGGSAAADSAASGTLRGMGEGDALPAEAPEFGAEAAPASDAPEGAYELSEVTVLPRPLNIGEIRRFMLRNYPPLLRDSGVQGTVQLRFRINTDGSVDASSIHVTVSSEPAFNLVSVRAVEMLRFSPAQVDGRPVRVWAELPIQFQVE